MPGSDAVQSLTEGTSDNGQQGEETLTVRKVRKDGKVFLEIIDPVEDTEPQEKNTPSVQKTPASIQSTERSQGRLKKCNDPKCHVTRRTPENRDVPIKRDTTVEKGENACTLPERRTPDRANQTGQTSEGP